MIVLQLAGVLLCAYAVVNAVQAWTLDRRMQAFRADDASFAWFIFMPVRWQRRLYEPDAHPLVDGAWKAVARMYAAATAGCILWFLGS